MGVLTMRLCVCSFGSGVGVSCVVWRVRDGACMRLTSLSSSHTCAHSHTHTHSPPPPSPPSRLQQWYDANVSLPGCDKNMPGSVIAMARLNRPSIMVYGGTIKPGHSVMDGSVLDIVSAFQSYGELMDGGRREKEWEWELGWVGLGWVGLA